MSPVSTQPPASPPSGVVYEAANLKREFDNGRVQALRGLDFRIQGGEFVAITGPSGCGKTTLLQILGSLIKPSSGSLLYRGKSLPDLSSPSDYRAREIGFIFQSFQLLPTYTAVENVQMPMFEMGWDANKRKAHAAKLLESVGLGHRVNQFPVELSGGERQRVAIARSLANGPTVLLADEPTGNLDSENAVLIMDLLARLHREQKMTLVLITHDIGIASSAGRILRMKDGRILSDGPPPTLSPAAS